MPKELIHGPVRNGEPDPNRAEVGWSREAEFVQLATHDGNPGHGHYVDLDRAACNKLIRDIRRARDQAFGADA